MLSLRPWAYNIYVLPEVYHSSLILVDPNKRFGDHAHDFFLPTQVFMTLSTPPLNFLKETTWLLDERFVG